MSPGLSAHQPPAARAPAPVALGPAPAARPTRLAGAVAAATGNRCGHSPTRPRFDLVTLPEDANHARPALIGQAIAKLQLYYGSPREERWDPLSQGERHHRLERQIEAAGGPDTEAGRPLADRLNRWRQQRSERREAVVAVLTLLLAYTDIETLNVAVPGGGGGWLGLSVPWIAERTGLSRSRVKRALATLTRAGVLVSTGAGRRYDARQRRWIGAGWGPVRRLSFDLIRRLGLEVSWDSAQRRRRKERLQAARPAPPLAPPPGTPIPPRERIRALRQRLRPRVANPDAPAPTTADQQAARARAQRIAELAAAGLSPAEIRQRLRDPPQGP
jgi:DNA-binding Lrp family transcriptional regulator